MQLREREKQKLNVARQGQGKTGPGPEGKTGPGPEEDGDRARWPMPKQEWRLGPEVYGPRGVGTAEC